MALPHYSEDQTSRKGKNFEPVQANLFEGDNFTSGWRVRTGIVLTTH